MPEEVSPKIVENSPKSGEVLFMSAVAEASFLLQRLAEPIRAKDTLKTMVRRVAPLVGLTQSRIEGLWQGKARQVLAEEMDAIRAAARQKEDAARAELRDIDILIARIEALEAASRVGARDADFHRPQDTARIEAVGISRRSLAEGGSE